MAKVYFNPKYHDKILFRVLPLLFDEIYFNAEHTNFDDFLIQACNKKIFTPVFNSKYDIAEGLDATVCRGRTDVVPEDEYDEIMEELSTIGAKVRYGHGLSKDYANEELLELFKITNWDLVISNYLGCNEIGFNDMIRLRKKMFLQSEHEIESDEKPKAVSDFMKTRNIRLPINLRISDIEGFRNENLFHRFNKWVEKEFNDHKTYGNESITVPDLMVNDYQRIVNTYAGRTNGQAGILSAVMTIGAAYYAGVPPIVATAAGAAATVIPSAVHKFLAREKWVYWMMNIESTKRNE
jgi:hypothetical protein